MPNTPEQAEFYQRLRAELEALPLPEFNKFLQGSFSETYANVVSAPRHEKIERLFAWNDWAEIAAKFTKWNAQRGQPSIPQEELLVLLPSPEGTIPTDSAQQVHALRTALTNSKHGRAVDVREHSFVTLKSIREALAARTARAMHIVTHGEVEGIQIQNYERQPVALAVDYLVDICKEELARKNPTAKFSLVTFAVCCSDEYAKALTPAVADCAIGITGRISPKRAERFYADFYSALGDGCSAAKAFKIAKMELGVQDVNAGDQPKLFESAAGIADKTFFPRQGPGRLFGPKAGALGFAGYLGAVAVLVWWLLEQFA